MLSFFSYVFRLLQHTFFSFYFTLCSVFLSLSSHSTFLDWVCFCPGRQRLGLNPILDLRPGITWQRWNIPKSDSKLHHCHLYSKKIKINSFWSLCSCTEDDVLSKRSGELRQACVRDRELLFQQQQMVKCLLARLFGTLMHVNVSPQGGERSGAGGRKQFVDSPGCTEISFSKCWALKTKSQH